MTIGRYCSIAGGVYCMGGQHPINRVTTSNMTFTAHQQHQAAARSELLADTELLMPFQNTYRAPKIEHDVWIGDHVLLREGVTLSTGCVVGGGAVVAKDVPPYAIVVGNPATIQRFRFPHKTIVRLLSSSWWQYHPKVLKDFGAIDVEVFLDGFEDAKAAGQLEAFHLEPLTWMKLESALCSQSSEP
jgi:virginiamycin A acetyltransferase